MRLSTMLRSGSAFALMSFAAGCTAWEELELADAGHISAIDAGRSIDAGRPPRCGDGNLTAGEDCDDGNGRDGDGCSGCRIEAGWMCSPIPCRTECGDGIVAGVEICDDANTDPLDGCSPACEVEPDYDCAGSPSLCVPRCGNGVRGEDESCDDGNTEIGDGCSSECEIEADWSCVEKDGRSRCYRECGDGSVMEPGELCDDGNPDDGDGCSSTCGVELGYECRGEPSYCYAICGDGIVAGYETCDDGDTEAGDGCNWFCLVESECETCLGGAMGFGFVFAECAGASGTVAPGDAEIGPALGVPRSQLCGDWLRCVWNTGCWRRMSGDDPYALDYCYCGETRPIDACTALGGIGVCAPIAYAGAETTDPMRVIERFLDPNYGLGDAQQLFEVARTHCTDECFPGWSE